MIFEFFKKLFWRADGNSRKRKSCECYENETCKFPKKCCINSIPSDQLLNNNEIINTEFDNVNRQLKPNQPLSLTSTINGNRDFKKFELSEYPVQQPFFRENSNINNIDNETFRVPHDPYALSKSTLHQTHQIMDRQKYSRMLLNFVNPNTENREQNEQYINITKGAEKTVNSESLKYVTFNDTLRHIEQKFHPQNESNESMQVYNHYILKTHQTKSSFNNEKLQCSCKIEPILPTDSDTYFTPKNVFKTNTLKEKFSTKEVIKQNFITQLADKYNSTLEQRCKEVEELKKMAHILAKHNRLTREAALEDHLNRSMRLCEAIYDEKDLLMPKMPQLDSKMLSKIELALSSGPVNEILVQEFGLSITRKDIQTLGGLNWLNDEIINFYMNLLITRGNNGNYPAVYAMNTFFYPKLVSGGHNSLKRWTRKIDIFSKDLIVVPVHLGIHWCMCIIDFRNKTVQYYDSMGSPNYKCLQVLKQYLQDESIDKKKKSFEFLGWNFECMQNIPQQMNGSDCGVFSCMFAEYISANKKLDFSQEDMPYFRKKMVYEILTVQLL